MFEYKWHPKFAKMPTCVVLFGRLGDLRTSHDSIGATLGYWQLEAPLGLRSYEEYTHLQMKGSKHRILDYSTSRPQHLGVGGGQVEDLTMSRRWLLFSEL